MQPRVVVGAGDRNRTGDVQLGNFLTVVSRTLRATALTSESHAVSLLLTQFGQHPGQQAPGRRPEAAVGLGEPVEGTIRDADAVLAEPAVDLGQTQAVGQPRRDLPLRRREPLRERGRRPDGRPPHSAPEGGELVLGSAGARRGAGPPRRPAATYLVMVFRSMPVPRATARTPSPALYRRQTSRSSITLSSR